MLHRKQPSDTSLNLLIDEVQIAMRDLPPDTEEFKLALGRLKDLRKLNDGIRRQPVSLDTLLVVTANLAGILIITHYEQLNAMTSRAASFVMKPSR